MRLGEDAHATALAWTMPGFAAFDTDGADVDGPEAVAADPPADAAHASGDAKADPVLGDTGAAEAPANGSSHSAPVHEEAETGSEPVNGDGASEEVPAEPSIANTIDATNRVPTADGRPRVIVQTVGPVTTASGQ